MNNGKLLLEVGCLHLINSRLVNSKSISAKDAYEKLLEICTHAIENNSWKRRPSTQNFYEKLLKPEIYEELKGRQGNILK